MFPSNDINYFFFKNISKSEFKIFIEKINNFLNKENINKVLSLITNNNNFSNYQKIIIIIFLDLSGNIKECSKLVDSFEEDFLLEIVKEKFIYNKLSRNIKQLIINKLSNSKWISNYKGSL
ncbi:MAG: hypothetical protein KatS3mg068_1613 [Candidatus Sericytochromatia bacterium]|nr:MAG: hypothetical protein KatS3mg068_1613 [Candidatus Sericytochromatia bacterium]